MWVVTFTDGTCEQKTGVGGEMEFEINDEFGSSCHSYAGPPLNELQILIIIYIRILWTIITDCTK